jgi:Ca2+-binding EF-hand superfamily protein
VLSPSEFERVFKFFDKNNDGVVSFTEFVSSIRGPLSGAKAKTINAIADKYFTTADPVIIKDFFEKNFDFSAYPSVKSGKKTKNQVLSEMASQFDHV